MRVTQNMMNMQFMRNLTNNSARMNDLQQVLATGKKLNKPSDDPVGVAYAMRYEAQLSRNDQYQKNLDAGVSWVETSDTSLKQANDVLQRGYELAVQGANGTNSTTSRQAIAKEVDQLYQQMVSIGNTQFNGKFIFNGQVTDVTPYSLNNAENDVVDTGAVKYNMSEGTLIQVNVTGDKAFGASTDADNSFRALKDLRDSLNSNNDAGIQTALGNVLSRLNKLQETRADVGATQNRMELISHRLSDSGLNLQALVSKTEDADVAQTITDMKMAESVQNASLSTGARIIQPTLVDFLK